MATLEVVVSEGVQICRFRSDREGSFRDSELEIHLTFASDSQTARESGPRLRHSASVASISTHAGALCES
jgi:hypothetical protein